MSTWDNSFWDVDDWDANTYEDIFLTLERTPSRTIVEGENMSVTPIGLKVGNTRPWQFTLRDETGGNVDLAGTATNVKVYMRLRGTTTNAIDGRTGTITGTTQGVMLFTPSSTEVGTSGTYDLEVRVVDSTSAVQRNFSNVMVVIRDTL